MISFVLTLMQRSQHRYFAASFKYLPKTNVLQMQNRISMKAPMKEGGINTETKRATGHTV